MSVTLQGAGEKFLEMQQQYDEAIAKFREDFPESNEIYKNNYQAPLPHTPTNGYSHVWDEFTNDPKNTYFK